MVGGRKVRSNKGKKRGSYKPRKHTKISVSPGGTRTVVSRKIRSNKGKKRQPYGPRVGLTRSGKRFRVSSKQSGGIGSGSGSGSVDLDISIPDKMNKSDMIKYKRHEFGLAGEAGNETKWYKYRPVVQNYKTESLGVTFSKELSSDKKPIVESVVTDSLANSIGIQSGDKLLGIFSGGVDKNLHCQTCGTQFCGSDEGGPITCYDKSFGSAGCLVGPPVGNVNVDKLKERAIKIGDVDKDKICWAFQPKDCEGNDCEGGGAGGSGSGSGD